MLGFVLIVVVAVMTFTFLLLGRLETYLLHDQENWLANQAKIARTSLEFGLQYSRVDRLSGLDETAFNALTLLARSMAAQTNCRILMTDASGRQVIDSTRWTRGDANYGGAEEIREAVATGYGADTRDDPTSHEYTMYVAYPVHSKDNQVIGVIRISKDVNSVRGLLHTIEGRIALSGAIAGIAAILVSLVMAFTIAVPLDRIRDAAVRFGRGDLSARSRISGSSEMAELSRVFDRMADRIERTVDELGELDEMKSNFVANVSHDLRTPLAAIKGLSETLLDGAIDDSEVNRKFVLDILSESERLLLMVNNVLNLARIEAGAVESHIEELDPAEVVKSILDRMSPVAWRVGVDLSVEEPEEHITVCADRMLLEQALANVVDNAIKFSSAKNFVRVSIEPGSGERAGTVISVVDTGCGIAPEEMDDLFKRFHASTDKSGGAGLGLAIARQAVESSGGTIDVKSKLGRGTTVRIRLPAGQ
jgi:two-component system OmpR family sensor kinase